MGTGPCNRMVQVICQAINGSSIPTSAGMLDPLCGWKSLADIRSQVQVGVGIAQVMVHGGVKNFIRGEKIVKKSSFTKHPGLWLT